MAEIIAAEMAPITMAKLIISSEDMDKKPDFPVPAANAAEVGNKAIAAHPEASMRENPPARAGFPLWSGDGWLFAPDARLPGIFSSLDRPITSPD